MTDPYHETVFGGINESHRGLTHVPAWFCDHYGYRAESTTFDPFDIVLGEFNVGHGAESTEAYYYDEERDEYREVPEQAVLVNPAWLGAGLADAPQDSAAWTTVSDQYEPVEAVDAYAPLVETAHALGYGEAFGCLTAYRNGGQVAIEVLFDDLRVSDPEGETEFILGFETGYDHFRRSSVWASLMAYDTESGAAMRGLSQRFTAPHRGDVQAKLTAWFETMFTRAEKLGETIYEVVAEARNYEVPIHDVPLTVADWYEAQGFPASYGKQAARRLSDTRTPTAFALYLAMARTVTDEFDGKRGGSALRRHAGRANEILYSPPSAEQEALAAAREELAGDGQEALTDEYESAVAALDERIATLEEGVEAFEDVRERVRSMLAEMDADDTASDDAEENAPAESDAANGVSGA
jgi:hypothetical protein